MRHIYGSLLVSLAAASLSVACSSEIARTNPYDPEGEGPKAPGRIEGTLYVQGASTPAGFEVHLTDDAGARVDGGLVTGADGRFVSPELSAGAYDLEVIVPLGNVPIAVHDIEVPPAVTVNVGLLTSLAEPPVGRIEGVVTLADTTASPGDVRIVATRLTGTVVESRVAYTDASGAYAFGELPPGTYELRADRSGFTPDLVQTAVESSTRSTASAPAMKLYPASAVIRFAVDSGSGELIGAPYTRERDVSLVLLAFGGVNEMRFAESADLTDGGVEVEWRDYVAQTPFTLSDGEGKKTVYAQFRVVDPVSGAERLRTEIYQTSVVFDASPPVLLGFTLAPSALERNGVRYLDAGDDASSVPVEVVALDPHSRVGGVKLVVEDADPALVPYADLTAFDASTTFFDTVALTPTDGEKRVRVQLKDGAGNESELYERTVTIDTTPPVALASPAVLVRGADDGQIRSLFVTLQFAVGGNPSLGLDGPVSMRYGVMPAPPSGASLSFFPEVSTLISATHGQSVQFYGVFADNAGNEVSLQSPLYTVNLRGTVVGKVLLEGEPDTGFHDGTTVEVFAAGEDLTTATPLASTTTAASGTYTVTNIPAGTVQVRIRRTGALPIVRSPVSVSAGATTDLGTERLILARGSLAGVARYGDLGASANHGGITVTATLGGRVMGSGSTDEAGAITLSGLPVSDAYEIRISVDGYVSSSLLGVRVTQDVIEPFNDDPVGCDATGAGTACSPIVLAKLTGDFKICDRDDAAPLVKDCAAILYTNKGQVLLGLDADNVTHVRYLRENPASPGVASFASPTATPLDAGAECTTPPQENCWNPYNPATHYLAGLGATEKQVTVLVQFANGSDVRPVGKATVVYDVTAPSSPTLSIARGTTALIDGFTNNPELALALTAVATSGDPADSSPVANVRVSRDATWDGNGTNGDRAFTYGGTKLFNIDASVDGAKSVYAWFCDAAGNCTASGSAVSDSIILDRAPPTRTNGRDIRAAGAGVTLKSLANREWWTRSTIYAVDLSVGTSPWSGMAEVAAYRLSLSEQFVGAEWVALDLDTIGPGDTVAANGAPLPPTDGDHVLWSQFKDAAGNVSTEMVADKLTLALDTVPPGGTVTLEAGAAYTRDNPVDVALTTDVDGGAVKIQKTWTGVLADPYAGARQDYAASFSEAAPVGDGMKDLLVRFFDAAGNFGERSDAVFLDTTPPENTAIASCDSCTYDLSGDPYFNDVGGNVTLFLFAADNSGVIASVEVVVDGVTATKRVLQYAPYANVTVSTAAGPHTLDVTFVDPAGNRRALAPFTVTNDRANPAVTVALDAGATWTIDPYVDVSVAATDGSDIMALYVSNSPTFGGAPTRTYASTVEDWLLDGPGTDGTKHVYIRVVDAAGNVNENEDTIRFDATAPSLAVSLSGPAAGGSSTTLTNATSVTVNLTSSDPGGADASGLSQMQVSNNADFSGASWVTYATSVASHPLASPSANGDKTVYVRVRDVAGNITASSATIELDRELPQLGAVSFLEGATTQDTSVTLSINATGAAEMRLTGPIGATSGTWIAFAPQANLTLTGADGSKSVSVEVRDAAGNTAADTRTTAITYDSPTTGKPTAGTVTVAGVDKDGASAARTRQQVVTVTTAGFADNAGGSGINAIMISESSVFTGAIWESCGSAACNQLMSRTLSSGDGPKTIYVKVRDAAGNESNAVNAAAIVLDTAAPVLSATLSGTAAGGASSVLTRTESISFTLTSTDTGGTGVSQYQKSHLADFSDVGTWSSFTGSPLTAAHTLDASTDGFKTVHFRVRDAAGNITATSASIELDKALPQLGAVSFQQGAATTSTSLTLLVNADGADQLQLTSTDISAPVSAAWNTFAPQSAVTITATNGSKSVSVRVRDAAGNLSADTRVVAITYDDATSGKPTAGTVTVTGTDKDGPSTARTRTQVVTLTTASFADNAGGSGITAVMISDSSVFSGAVWESCSAASCNQDFARTLSSGDGNKTLYVKVKDAAGNESATATSNTIRLDTTAPTVSASLEGVAAGGASTTLTRDENVTVTLTSTDTPGSGVIEYQKSHLADFSDVATWSSYTGSPLTVAHVLDAAADGFKTVYFRVRDRAGNVAATSAAIELDKTLPQLGAVSFQQGAATTSAGVTLLASASGATDLRLTSADISSPTSGTWFAYSPQTPVTLITTTNGSKSVTVRVRDAAGNLSADTRVVAITYDDATTGKPTAGTVTVTGTNRSGASTTETRTSAVTVVTSGFTENAGGSGITALMVSESSVFSGAAWESCTGTNCNQTMTRVLSSGDGNKTVYVKVKDAAGNESTTATSNVIKLDTVAPTLTVALQGTVEGATSSTQYTRLAGITVLPTAADAGSGLSPITGLMQTAITSDFSSASWANLGNTAWTLAGADGTKRIYVKVRDLAGNEVIADGSIVFDTQAPYSGSVLIDAGASYTSSLSGRTLTLNAADALSGVKQMAIANTAAPSTYETYAATKSAYALAAGIAGARTVYVRFRDNAGNETADFADSITADLAAPSAASFTAGGFSGSTCLNGTEHWVSSTRVSLTLAATDDVGIKEFKIAENGNFGSAAWIPWTTSYSFTLSNDNGEKAISLKVRDYTDREFDASDVCVTLDTAAPVNVAVATYTDAACTIPAVNNYVGSQNFYLAISAEDEATNGSAAYVRFDDNTDVDYFVSGTTYYDSQTVSTFHYYNATSSFMPLAACLRGRLATTATTETLSMYVRDEVGNWSPRTTATVSYDATAPSIAPTLTSVVAGNRSAKLFWNAAADAESGIKEYQLFYRTTQPVNGAFPGTANAIIPAGTSNYEVTGLSNHTRYEFKLVAVNNAGLSSAASNLMQTTVGYVRHNAAFSSTNTVIPFGVSVYDGVIYVGYLQYEVLWGEVASTLHLAVSRDAGVSWQQVTVDENVTTRRETAALYAGPSGVVVAAAHDSDAADGPIAVNLDLAAWRSADQGITWTKVTLDANMPEPASGIAMTAEGGALVVLYTDSSTSDLYNVRSTDGGRTWRTRTASLTRTSDASHVGACNSQAAVDGYIRTGETVELFYSNNLGYLLTVDASASTTMTGIRHVAVGCTSPVELATGGKAYAAFIKSGVFNLYLRKNSSASGSSWDDADGTLYTGNVDHLYRPAIYVNGFSSTETAFVAFKRTNGDVYLGTSTTPDTVSSYSWVAADTAGDGGVNLVMSGLADGSPVLAYTDESGHQLYVLRTALPAPNMRVAPGEAEISLSWSAMTEDQQFLITYGSTLGTMTNEIMTSLTSYYSDTISTPYIYEAQAVDDALQVGEPGLHWELARFNLGAVDNGTLGSPTSQHASLRISGTTQWSMLPVGTTATGTNCTATGNICLYYSTNGGASFSDLLITAQTAASPYRHMAVGPNASGNPRVYVAYVDEELTHPDLDFRYADSPYTVWSGQEVGTTGGLLGKQFTDVQVSTGYSSSSTATTDGQYVLVAWVSADDGTTDFNNNVRYNFGSSYGTAWTGMRYVNSANTDTDLGYTPRNLTIIDHTSDDAYLAWLNASGQVVTNSTYALTDADGIGAWSASVNTVSDGDDDITFMRGARYKDNYSIAFIGKTDTGSETDDTVNVYVTGSGARTDLAAEWATVRLDNEQPVTSSLGIVMNDNGTYVSYATARMLFGVTTRQWKLAYCRNECSGRDNWHVAVVKVESDTSTVDFRGIALDVERSTGDIGMSGTVDSSGTDYYRTEYGARWRRMK